MKVSILGATGSIGRQALDVAEHLGLRVIAITGNKNFSLLEEQARHFMPKMVVAADEDAARELKTRLADTSVNVLTGADGLIQAAQTDVDTIVSAIIGTAGLLPTLEAVKSGRRVALANKESLVCAGEQILSQAEASGAQIVPVDSEHSAIFQCMQGGGEVRKVLLTASGGPFFGYSFEELESVTKEQALQHPNWNMGEKITVDCATLMNKGLEFIEAMRLFSLKPEQIEIIIHRESVIHSAVEFIDGSVIAQLAQADMRLPIQYAFTYPERRCGQTSALDLVARGKLSFFKPDFDAFRCLDLALSAAKKGGSQTAALSAANEVAVKRFLNGQARFNDIFRIIDQVLTKIEFIEYPSIEDILKIDTEARKRASEVMI